MEEGFVDIKKQVVLSKEEIKFAQENPAGLTKEGCEHELRMAKMSTNKYLKKMYEYMLANCKNFAQSGKTVDGKVILARRDGKIIWSEQIE